jgi:hypothetical protein
MAALRRAGLVSIVVMLALGLAGAVAGAKTKGHAWSSTIKLAHPSTMQFTGTVGSKLAACRKQRLVTLYYADPTTGQTQPLSVQRTDGKGRYEVDLTQPAYAGAYQAQVSKERIRALKAPQTCRGAQSGSIHV